MTDLDKIISLKPTPGALAYFEAAKNFSEAWKECHNGDFLIDIATLLKVDIQTIALAKYECVNQVRHLIKHRAYALGIHQVWLQVCGKALKRVVTHAKQNCKMLVIGSFQHGVINHSAHSAIFHALTTQSSSNESKVVHYVHKALIADSKADLAKSMAISVQLADECRKALTTAISDKLRDIYILPT